MDSGPESFTRRQYDLDVVVYPIPVNETVLVDLKEGYSVQGEHASSWCTIESSMGTEYPSIVFPVLPFPLPRL